MANEQKDMAGVIFANDKKTTEKHPDGTGKCMIDGVMYFIDSWNNTSANGVTYRSMKFKRMEKQPQAAAVPSVMPARPTAKVTAADYDDPIPF